MSGRCASLLIGLVALGSAATVTAAVEPWRPKASEMPLLPPYCKVRFESGMDSSRPGVAKWQRRLGPDYLHVHHYCAGLNFLNRANRIFGDDNALRYNLQQAVSNFDYMFNNASQSFVLMPEIYVQYGRAAEKQGDPGRAAQSYRKAIELKRDYALPYAALADLQAKLGNRAEALTTVEEGLAANPRSKSLRRRLRDLGTASPR